MVIYYKLFLKLWDHVPWTPSVSLCFIWFLILSSVSGRVTCLMFQGSWKCLFLLLWEVAITISVSLICSFWYPHLSKLNYLHFSWPDHVLSPASISSHKVLCHLGISILQPPSRLSSGTTSKFAALPIYPQNCLSTYASTKWLWAS